MASRRRIFARVHGRLVKMLCGSAKGPCGFVGIPWNPLQTFCGDVFVVDDDRFYSIGDARGRSDVVPWSRSCLINPQRRHFAPETFFRFGERCLFQDSKRSRVCSGRRRRSA